MRLADLAEEVVFEINEQQLTPEDVSRLCDYETSAEAVRQLMEAPRSLSNTFDDFVRIATAVGVRVEINYGSETIFCNE